MAEILKKQKEEFEKRRKEFQDWLKKEREELGKIRKESERKAKEFLAWHKGYIEKYSPRPRRRVERKKK